MSSLIVVSMQDLESHLQKKVRLQNTLSRLISRYYDEYFKGASSGTFFYDIEPLPSDRSLAKSFLFCSVEARASIYFKITKPGRRVTLGTSIAMSSDGRILKRHNYDGLHPDVVLPLDVREAVSLLAAGVCLLDLSLPGLFFCFCLLPCGCCGVGCLLLVGTTTTLLHRFPFRFTI